MIKRKYNTCTVHTLLSIIIIDLHINETNLLTFSHLERTTENSKSLGYLLHTLASTCNINIAVETKCKLCGRIIYVVLSLISKFSLTA